MAGSGELVTPRRSRTIGTVALTLRLACPRCGRVAYGVRPRAGDLLLDCAAKRCRTAWWAIVVPPRATGAWLRTLLDAPLALEVLRPVGAQLGVRGEDALWQIELAPATSRAFLQVAVDPLTRDRALHVDTATLTLAAVCRMPAAP